MDRDSFRKAVKDAADLGREMFLKHAYGLNEDDVSIENPDVRNEDWGCLEDSDSESEPESEDDVLDLTHVGEGDAANIIRTSGGRGCNLQAAVTHFFSQGRCLLHEESEGSR